MRACLSLLSMLVFLALMTGCEGPLTATPYGYGEATRNSTRAMIANPKAAKENPEPKLGVSGTTAEGIMENYRHNEKTENQRKWIENEGTQVETVF